MQGNSERDNLRLLGLLNNYDYQGRAVVIGMGKQGQNYTGRGAATRQSFAFASLSKGKETAEGQNRKGHIGTDDQVVNR